jgi:hypothetical protein
MVFAIRFNRNSPRRNLLELGQLLLAERLIKELQLKSGLAGPRGHRQAQSLDLAIERKARAEATVELIDQLVWQTPARE